jgi:hypothetical protein
VTGRPTDAELALSTVGMVLSLASFAAPHPVVLAAPGFVLSVVMLVVGVRRLRGGAR